MVLLVFHFLGKQFTPLLDHELASQVVYLLINRQPTAQQAQVLRTALVARSFLNVDLKSVINPHMFSLPIHSVVNS